MTMHSSARDVSTPDNDRHSATAGCPGPLARRRFADRLPSAAVLSAVLATALAVASPTQAAEPTAGKSTPSAASKPTKTIVAANSSASTAPMTDTVVAAASPEQVNAATYVYLGEYDCDFKQVLQITASQRYPAYLDLRFGKSVYLMKPVVSPTGAIRLEDVRGEALLVQIARKSMLLNTRTGSRMVDECVSATQRSLIEAARSTAVEVAMPSKGMLK
jgi:hypothetical protein